MTCGVSLTSNTDVSRERNPTGWSDEFNPGAILDTSRINSRDFSRPSPRTSAVQELLSGNMETIMMSLVRLLGFTKLACGCVTGRYREVATNREVTYVEEKGASCDHSSHRRNHTLATARLGVSVLTAKAS